MSDDPAMDKILDQIGKLLQLAAKAGTPAEGEAAAAKAQELMDKYNLDTIALERRTGATSGKREKEMLDGGFFAYQRWLFRKVAELNFCTYFCEEYRSEIKKAITHRKADGREYYYPAGHTTWKTRHRLVGRTVNVQATKIMVTYLSQAINRVLKDKLRKSDGTIGAGQMMSAWAVSFREGAVSRLTDKIEEERERAENKRKAQRKRAAKVAGVAAGQALTLLDLKESEEQGNHDFLYGEGAWARMMADRAEDAAEEKREREAHARLAKEDPEEYQRIEAARRKAARAYRGPRYRAAKVSDPGGYNAGFDAAEGISLHQQVDAPAKPVARIGR